MLCALYMIVQSRYEIVSWYDDEECVTLGGMEDAMCALCVEGVI